MGNILAGLGKPNRRNNNAGGHFFLLGSRKKECTFVQAVRPSALGRARVTKIGFSCYLLASHPVSIFLWLRAEFAAAGPFSVEGQEIGMHPWCRPPGRVLWARRESICEMACKKAKSPRAPRAFRFIKMVRLELCFYPFIESSPRRRACSARFLASAFPYFRTENSFFLTTFGCGLQVASQNS